MAKKIIFTVKGDGTVDVDASQGYEGKSCLDDTAAVVETLKAMGIEITAENIKMAVVAQVQEVSNDQLAKS